MPELPEVETVRRQLDEQLRGRVVVSVDLLRSGREAPVGRRFVDAIQGRTLDRVDRRAKLLVFRFADGGAMTAHLKMTGRFVFVDDGYVPGKHDRAVFTFAAPVATALSRGALRAPRPGRDDAAVANESRGSSVGAHPASREKRGSYWGRLVWSDIRQFGFVRVVDDAELERILAAYGPEPLEHSATELADRLITPKTRMVKAALLNQEVIAGVGNIYADESLHRAGIRPMRRLGRITQDERLRLATEIQNILNESIAQQGTSANDYVDTRGEKGGFLSLLRVYGREGEPCLKCKTPIKKIVLGQRGTHYCPGCQD